MALNDDQIFLPNFPAAVTVSSRVRIRERPPAPVDKAARNLEAGAGKQVSGAGADNMASRGRPHV